MIEQTPLYVQITVWIMVAVMVLGVSVLIAMIFWAIWMAWKQHKNEQGGHTDEGGKDGRGGNGGRDRPTGKPPGGGGPDRSIDEQFHALADMIGKTIEIDEKEKEKVLQ
jgi:hypothetical protein